MAHDEVLGIDADVALVRTPGLHEARHEEAIVVLDQRAEQCHVLGGSAGSIWSLIDNRRTLAEIIEELATVLALNPADIGPEVSAAAESFRGIGLVELVTPDQEVTSSEFEASSEHIGTHSRTKGPATFNFSDVVRGHRRSRWSPMLVRRVGARENGAVLGPFAFGDLTVRIATDDPEIAGHLRSVLRAMAIEPGAAPEGEHCDVVIVRERHETEPRCRIWIDGLLHRRQLLSAVSVEYVMSELNILAVAGTRNSILLHAGAVERDGRVVVVAGVSGRGKSTLTATLVRAGFRYVTDEMAIIDPGTGWVRPYHKPLDLGSGSLEMLELRGHVDERFVVDKFRVNPLSIGELSTGGQIAMVVVLTNQEGPEIMDGVEILATIDALSAILPNVFAETYGIADPLQKIVDLCERHPVIALPRLPLGETVAIVEQVLSTR